MKDLPIPLLRTFTVVAKTLNLTSAATQLHKAPSTISMQLSRLESTLETELFVRGQHGIRLTPEGDALISDAIALLSLHDRILGNFRHHSIEGPVRFGTHDQYATRTLTPVLEAFVLAYPEAKLDVICDHRPHKITELIAQGSIDLALVEMPKQNTSGECLTTDQLIWVKAENHPTDQLSPLPLASFNEGCYHRSCGHNALQSAKIPFRTAFTSQSRAGILTAVRAGIGVGIIPRSTLEKGLTIIDHLPTLPETNTTLLVSEQANQPSLRLADTIRNSQIFATKL